MSERSNGKNAFAPLNRRQPQFTYLIDNQLNPYLARALREADWDAVSVHEMFGVSATESVKDQEIIPRLVQEGRAWVTADESARRDHREALLLHPVSVLWIAKPKDGWSSAYQFAVLTAALIRFDLLLERVAGKTLRARVGWTLGSIPKSM